MTYKRIFSMLINIKGIVSMLQVLLDHRIEHFKIIICKLSIGFMQGIANRCSKNGPLKVIYVSNDFICSYMFACWSKLFFKLLVLCI